MWRLIDDTYPEGIIGPVWNVVRLGDSQREGVVLIGWGWHGSFGGDLSDVKPVRVALLEQQSDGTLVDATERLLGDAITNGGNSVIAADFNGDGLDDLVFPAHNESPFIAKASTAYLSRSDGGFDKLTLSDRVMAHDARLATLDGRKVILAASYGGRGNDGPSNPMYSWSGNTFEVDTSLGFIGVEEEARGIYTGLRSIDGLSIAAGPFTGNTDTWVVVGDSRPPRSMPDMPQCPVRTYAYKYNDGVLSTPPVLLPMPYFNDKSEYESFESEWDPCFKTHTPELWTTDLNQDGLPDILAGQMIWAFGAGQQKTVIQLLINRGDIVFTDETDALDPEYFKDSSLDNSMRLADVDGSGIDTILMSSLLTVPDDLSPEYLIREGPYILVNDGTGRLYSAMHEEFNGLPGQIAVLWTATCQQAEGRQPTPCGSLPTIPPLAPSTSSQSCLPLLPARREPPALARGRLDNMLW